MASFKSVPSSGWILLKDRNVEVENPDSLAISEESSECTWKDCLAICVCLISFGVAAAVVFVQKWAVHWGSTGQFVWVGLSLTIMSWCSQLFLRRLFLVTAIHFRSSSTLQTMDSILRSDPLTSHSTWTFRVSLFCMVGLAPLLSAIYKSLGNGESSYESHTRSIQIGLIGPPGTQNLGFGLSQFINATLPWFDKPALNQTYGFNTYTLDANTTAVLEGPIPAEVKILQESLGREQWATITGDVSALVGFLNPDLEYDRADLSSEFADAGGPSAMQLWTGNGNWNRGLFLPDPNNSTNIYLSAFDVGIGEEFGDHARHYQLYRQTYVGRWHVTQRSVQLAHATPVRNERLDDEGVFTTIFASIPETLIPGIVEYDTYYREANYRRSRTATTVEEYLPFKKDIETDVTPIVIGVWSRYVAYFGPEMWGSQPFQRLTETQRSTLLYSRTMSIKRGAITIRRDWEILLVLILNPVLLFGSLAFRVLRWPRSPIGGGFGVVSLLASMDKDCQPLLDGAGLSGRLKRPVSVAFDVKDELQGDQLVVSPDGQMMHFGRITMFLGRSEAWKSGTLRPRIPYR